MRPRGVGGVSDPEAKGPGRPTRGSVTWGGGLASHSLSCGLSVTCDPDAGVCDHPHCSFASGTPPVPFAVLPDGACCPTNTNRTSPVLVPCPAPPAPPGTEKPCRVF